MAFILPRDLNSSAILEVRGCTKDVISGQPEPVKYETPGRSLYRDWRKNMPPVRLSGLWGTRALRGAGHRRESPGAQFSAHAKPFRAVPLGVPAVAQQQQVQRIMDLGDWLRSLDLERYEAAFRENEIDDTILPRLTAEDLKELGVGPVGHRRKLLDAIATLRADANAPLPAPSPTVPPIAARASPLIAEAVGERRYLTVMFCDLVDSTGIAARLDAEEWRDLVNAYLDDASAA